MATTLAHGIHAQLGKCKMMRLEAQEHQLCQKWDKLRDLFVASNE